ncbi:MAG: hypothetical protein J5789_09145 [Oscillospiraceae bacterium]|nr:hypothetical protein [Oscillospiraceae bacterium]
MDFLSSHPVTIALALVSLFVWTSGNRSKNKKLVFIGIGISVVATVTFFLGI